MNKYPYVHERNVHGVMCDDDDDGGGGGDVEFDVVLAQFERVIRLRNYARTHADISPAHCGADESVPDARCHRKSIWMGKAGASL